MLNCLTLLLFAWLFCVLSNVLWVLSFLRSACSTLEYERQPRKKKKGGGGEDAGGIPMRSKKTSRRKEKSKLDSNIENRANRVGTCKQENKKTEKTSLSIRYFPSFLTAYCQKLSNLSGRITIQHWTMTVSILLRMRKKHHRTYRQTTSSRKEYIELSQGGLREATNSEADRQCSLSRRNSFDFEPFSAGFKKILTGTEIWLPITSVFCHLANKLGQQFRRGERNIFPFFRSIFVHPGRRLSSH